MTVITVFNQKGGVGKTTTTVNLAAALARMQHKPVAIDLDAQAHLTLSLEIYDKIGQHVGDALCRTCITECVSLAESPGHGMDIFSYAPQSQGAKDYRLLGEELQSAGFFEGGASIH